MANKSINITDEMLDELLSGLDDDIVVPEAASKAWRSAIKKEARERRSYSVIRRLSSMAAAVLVLVGFTLLFRSNGMLASQTEYKAEKSRNIRANRQEVVMLAADSAGAADDVVYARSVEPENAVETVQERSLNASCSFGVNTADEGADIVRTAIEGVDAYIQSSSATSLSYTALVRVANDDLDTFIGRLSGTAEGFSCSVESVSLNESTVDIDTRINAAYETAAVLETAIAAGEKETAADYYNQLKNVYDDIEALEALSTAHADDLSYARVSVTANVNGFMPRLRSAVSGFINGFGNDAVITLVIFMPVIIIAATCYMLLRKKKSRS